MKTPVDNNLRKSDCWFCDISNNLFIVAIITFFLTTWDSISLKRMFIFFLQLNDCHRGVVFDGLENLFAQNLYITAHAILRALNNRRFIYFVTMKLDYNVLKEQEKKAEEERGQLAWHDLSSS